MSVPETVSEGKRRGHSFEAPPPLPLPLRYEGEGELVGPHPLKKGRASLLATIPLKKEKASLLVPVGFDEIHSLRYFAPRAVLVPRLVTIRMRTGRDEEKPLSRQN